MIRLHVKQNIWKTAEQKIGVQHAVQNTVMHTKKMKLRV